MNELFAELYLAVELSDDDVELAEVASQCGYDFKHPLVSDVAEPMVAEWHGEPCLLLRLTLSAPVSAAIRAELESSGAPQLSHPSVATFSVLGIQTNNH